MENTNAAPLTLRQRSIDERLRAKGSSLADFLASRRVKGHTTSWQMLSHELRDATGEYVSYETLRRWHEALCVEDVAA